MLLRLGCLLVRALAHDRAVFVLLVGHTGLGLATMFEQLYDGLHPAVLPCDFLAYQGTKDRLVKNEVGTQGAFCYRRFGSACRKFSK
jgi:hypothetical protein